MGPIRPFASHKNKRIVNVILGVRFNTRYEGQVRVSGEDFSQVKFELVGIVITSSGWSSFE